MLPRTRFPILLLAVLVCAAGSEGTAGQEPAPRASGLFHPDASERMTLHAFSLSHRSAAEAAELVRGMLSPRGRVTVQEERNTVVVRDTLATMARVVPALRQFDRPARPLEFELMVVRAYRERVVSTIILPPPRELVNKLRKLLNYSSYELVAMVDLPSREGEELTYQVGDSYSVGFRVGELGSDESVKLYDFRLFRRGREEPMIHTNLNLFVGKTYSLGFSKSEDSETALMVVITCRGTAPAAEPQR
jgi:hypothetical protein